jgi:hypothetical protein
MDCSKTENELKYVKPRYEDRCTLTRPVKNKFLVSLNVSTSFSASSNHALSASSLALSLEETRRIHNSWARLYPFKTSLSFPASSSFSWFMVSLVCALVDAAVLGPFPAAARAFSSNRDPDCPTSVPSRGATAFFRESITKISSVSAEKGSEFCPGGQGCRVPYLRKRAQGPF